MQKLNLKDLLPEEYSYLEMNTEFESVFKNILEGKNLLVTGPAGVGKSELLKLVTDNRVLCKHVQICGSTGLSAVNVGGQTLHSYFGIPIHDLRPTPRLVQTQIISRRKAGGISQFKRLEVLVIDEVSMVSAPVLDYIDLFLRGIRKQKASRLGLLPFGGVQVILFGDIAQLPPVVRRSEDYFYYYLKREYGEPFFFNSHVWKKGDFSIHKLIKVYRQNDPEFLDILQRIRYGEATSQDLKRLNENVMDEENFIDIYEDYLHITPTNKMAKEVNDFEMSIIDSEEITYTARHSPSFPQDMFPVDLEITLKKGAQVMVRCNDKSLGVFNGMMGEITEVYPSSIDFMPYHEDREYPIHIGTFKWGMKSLKVVNHKEGEELVEENYEEIDKGTFHQIPVIPAFAITIHKSQGLTLDHLYLDMGRGAFSHGQTYVALSRCRSLKGLGLRKAITKKDIIFDKEVSNFMKKNGI